MKLLQCAHIIKSTIQALPNAKEVEPFRDKAYFWSQIWKSSGRPVKCEVQNIMKRSRNTYNYQLKNIRKSEDIIRKKKLLNTCLGDEGNIFEEIKDMRKTDRAVASSIDGESRNISNHFSSSIYSKLFNSANDNEEVKDISEKVENLITPDKIKDVEAVTPEVVKQAAEKLKPGKSDPTFSLFPEL